MNLNELENALTSFEYTYKSRYSDFTYEETTSWHEYWCGEIGDALEIPGVGKVSIEATHGGEGEGDQAWVVLRIEHEDGTTKFYRKDGYYASYDGAEFDGDFRQVVPTPKTITVYEAI